MQKTNHQKIQKFCTATLGSDDQVVQVCTPSITQDAAQVHALTPTIVHTPAHTTTHVPRYKQMASAYTSISTHSPHKQIQQAYVHSVLQNFHTPTRKKVGRKTTTTFQNIQWPQIVAASLALLLLALTVGPLFNHVSAALASL